MREPKNARHLAAHEIAIARSVFRDTIPYGEVLVSDGLGGGDRPFTVPTSMPVRLPFYANFNAAGGRYVIHAGDGYNGMSQLERDRKTLVHELAHVWQGENDAAWSWSYVLFSLKDQALLPDAYAYDAERLRPWDDYGPEQQAQIVEDWYAAGMQPFDPVTQTGDRRFYFIKKHIRHEPVAGDWTIVPLRPLEAGTLRITPSYPDALGIALLPILEQPLRAGDHAGITARVRTLEESFGALGPEIARRLASRLELRQRGDRLAQSFHERLAAPTRHRLLHVLRMSAAGR